MLAYKKGILVTHVRCGTGQHWALPSVSLMAVFLLNPAPSKRDLCSALEVQAQRVFLCFLECCILTACRVSRVKVRFGAWKDQHDSEINDLCFWHALRGSSCCTTQLPALRGIANRRSFGNCMVAGKNTETFKMAA